MEKKNFLWVNFYTAFADKLLGFENDRKTLLDKLTKVYSDLGMKFQKLEQDDSIVDIDPFTIFGMFNKGITEANRIAIIKAFAKEFGVDSSVEIPTNFDGIPVLNNLKAVFFGWSRPDTDIDNLWTLFRVALQYADAADKTAIKDSFIEIYNKVIKQSCIKWNITMGLYWIRPYTFLNLDSRTRWFIKGYCADLVNGNVKGFKDVPNAETYLSLSESATANLLTSDYEYKNLTELSYAAFEESERVNQENKKAAEAEETVMVEEDANAVHYWLYSPGQGADKWDEFYDKGIMAIGWGEIGDLSRFEDKNQMKETMKTTYNHPDRSYKNDAHAAWQFAKEMKVGDVIFVKRGMYQIVGCGVVESDYIYDENQPGYYDNVRKVKWTHKGTWQHPGGQAVLKTLTDITQYTEYVEKLKALFEAEEGVEIEEKEIVYPPYTAENFLDEVFMSEEDYTTLVDLVMEKQNVILQGAPGVGKTFAARRLAYSMMGVQDSERVMMVQFHQSYSYEDFIMGYRPTENGGFVLKNGPFYNFCKKAENDSDNDYFFIIDEINRGNLSKIFGELFKEIMDAAPLEEFKMVSPEQRLLEQIFGEKARITEVQEYNRHQEYVCQLNTENENTINDILQVMASIASHSARAEVSLKPEGNAYYLSNSNDISQCSIEIISPLSNEEYNLNVSFYKVEPTGDGKMKVKALRKPIKKEKVDDLFDDELDNLFDDESDNLFNDDSEELFKDLFSDDEE